MRRGKMWKLAAVSCAMWVQQAEGANFDWVGGLGAWNNPAKWSPAGGPPNAGDNATIMGLSATVLTADVLGLNSPNSLSLGNDGELATNEWQFRVNGPLQIFGPGTHLYVRPVAANTDLFGVESTSDITINPLAEVHFLNGAKVKAADSFSLGNGTVWFDAGGTLVSPNIQIGDGSGSSDANVNVNGSAVARFEGTTSFQDDADVVIFNGSTLQVAGNARFVGGTPVRGAGLLQLDGATNQVVNATTIDMPNGRIDLDGTDTPFSVAQSLSVNEAFVLNVEAIDSSGNTFGVNRLVGEDTIHLNNFGKLTVNLTDPNAAWTMRGHMDVNAPGGNIQAGNLAGSDMILRGTANISGNSGWTARTDVIGEIMVEANSSLALAGGDQANPSRMMGGVVKGPGRLVLLTNDALVGFGTIHSEIEFLTNCQLLADDGTLVLSPSHVLTKVGTIGTRDADGILEVQKAWNTDAAADGLVLKGGSVVGEALTNGGATRGFGMVASAAFVNTGVVQPVGGELVIDTTANPDLDGLGLFGSGAIDATKGDLRVKDSLADSFNGSVSVGPGHTVTFEKGWILDTGVLPPLKGVLTLDGGASALNAARVAGGSQRLFSIVNVDQEAAFDAPTLFGSTVQVNLAGATSRLRLFEPATIEAGATFAGNGALVNVAANMLRMEGGAHVGTDFLNAGIVEIADSTADASVKSLDTTSLSELRFDIRGKLGAQFDTLIVNETAKVDGELDVRVNLGSGTYVDPAVRGDFDIFPLIVAGQVQGKFNEFVYEGTTLSVTSSDADDTRHHAGNGLFRTVKYRDKSVQLMNYLAIVGDSDGDGAFDSGDMVRVFQAGEYEDGIVGNSDWTEGDWNSDGEFNTDDFIAAFQAGTYEKPPLFSAVAGGAEMMSAVAVPEPSTGGLFLAAIGGLMAQWRRVARRRAHA